MSQFSQFMRGNKILKENQKFAVTKSLVDERGEPLVWEIRPVTTKENDLIREECITDVAVLGKGSGFRQKLNTGKYMGKLIASSVVYPNLNDKGLQDSYGVMCSDELLKAMVDDPGEYGVFAAFVQRLNGFTSIDQEVEQAKN